MRSVGPMRMAKIGYILISCLLCVFGVVLIADPGFSVSMLGVLCGILLIAFGLVKMIGYFSRDLYRLAFQYDLAFGLMLIALGIIMLTSPDSLMYFICITLGISILADGLFKIQIALEARRFGLREWWLILLLAVLTGVCGVVLLLRPGFGSRVLVVWIGITMLAEGILSFSTVITAVKIVKHQKPDAADVIDVL